MIQSTYHELLEKSNCTRMLIKCTIATDVFNSLHELNPNFMKEIFNIKQLTYALRDHNIAKKIGKTKLFGVDHLTIWTRLRTVWKNAKIDTLIL